MKKANMKTIRIIRLAAALLISMLMCFCMSACGDNSNTEETVEISTPSEETETPLYQQSKSEDESKDKDGSGDEDSKDSKSDKKSGSQYEQIYKDCNTAMEEATDKYVKELKEKASSLSKSKLYDETQSRIDELKKIYDDGKGKMVDAMLASTEDDEKEYTKYFDKLTEAYTEFTRDITSAYTDAF